MFSDSSIGSDTAAAGATTAGTSPAAGACCCAVSASVNVAMILFWAGGQASQARCIYAAVSRRTPQSAQLMSLANGETAESGGAAWIGKAELGGLLEISPRPSKAEYVGTPGLRSIGDAVGVQCDRSA